MPTEATQPVQSRKPTRNERREAVRAACARLGVTIIPLEGGGYRLHRPDVDLKVSDLCYVDLRDLSAGGFEEERRRA